MIRKENQLGLLSDIYFLKLFRTAKYVDDREGISLFIAKDKGKWDKELKNTSAYTFGDCVVFRSREEFEDPRIFKHERAHVQQIRQAGGNLIHFPRYWWSMLKAWTKTGNPWANEYEAEAERAEIEE